MSKAAKQSIFILIILLLATAGFAGYIAFEKQKLEQTNFSLTDKITDLEIKEQKVLNEKKKLEDQLQEVDLAKKKFESDFNQANERLQQINTQIDTLTSERDDWKGRFEGLQKERDDLLAQIKDLSEKKPALAAAPPEAKPAQEQAVAETVQQAPIPSETDESYWALVLKQKAELEVQLVNFKNEVSGSQIQISELKKQNSDLQLEIDSLKTDKEMIDRKIKKGQDLAETLSLELARSKSDSQFMTDRISKLMEDNNKLHEQIKQLTTTKVALEKSIVQLTEEKNELSKKLYDTENVIQDRIQEIWGIKEGIDQQLKSENENVKEIELQPIVVNSANGVETGSGMRGAESKADQQGNLRIPSKGSKENSRQISEGNVVSVNEENNFVIVDIGEGHGIKVGIPLSVYRGSKFIAGLEVIQTRKDICAADIKNKVSPIKVGDTVRH